MVVMTGSTNVEVDSKEDLLYVEVRLFSMSSQARILSVASTLASPATNYATLGETPCADVSGCIEVGLCERNREPVFVEAPAAGCPKLTTDVHQLLP